MVIVERYLEIGKVAEMFGMAARNQLFRRNAFLARTDHYRSAVGVIRADVNALVSTKFLETRPKIGLQVLDQMTKMDIPVCIGECACNDDFPFFRHICLASCKLRV